LGNEKKQLSGELISQKSPKIEESVVQVLRAKKNIFLFAPRNWGTKKNRNHCGIGVFRCNIFLVAQHGPTGNNGFDQTPIKSSVYGTCAHSSSTDQKQDGLICLLSKK